LYPKRLFFGKQNRFIGRHWAIMPGQKVGELLVSNIKITETKDVAYVNETEIGFILNGPVRKKYRQLSLRHSIFNFFNTGAGHKVSAFAIDLHFKFWKLWHPGAKFSDYYAGSIAASLKRGGTHKTLGNKKFLSGSYISGPAELDVASHQKHGKNHFETAIKHGLLPKHTCIDYGCGSLRVGQHLINYLEPRNYLGLDIISDFYEAGKTLLPSQLMERKQPEFQTIDQTPVVARRADADFIVSFAVLKHVPPSELDAYFRGIIALMASRTKVLIDFNESKRTARAGAKIWNYCADEIVRSFLNQDEGLTYTVNSISGGSDGGFRRGRSLLLIERNGTPSPSFQGTWGAC
jgi:hypothetical protein